MHSLEYKDGQLILLDQTQLPATVAWLHCTDYRQVAHAIQILAVRGAPVIGVAAAFAMVLGARELIAMHHSAFLSGLEMIGRELKATRPTAVNLAWAVEQMLASAQQHAEACAQDMITALEDAAQNLAEQDIAINRALGTHGASLLTDGMTVLTHCNAGALATVGFGTALGVIRAARAQGKNISVFADETRPLLQGARLTAWELQQDGIPVTLISDNMAGYVMQLDKVQAVIVGADRVARNGDVANKIGTYGVAVLAHEHQIPFYVAVPYSTFDLTLADGQGIPIEQRNSQEVTHFQGVQTAPTGVDVFNPAFDVTPAHYISALITEKGVLYPPFVDSIAYLFGTRKER